MVFQKSATGPAGAEFLSAIQFHQSFMLPANPAHGRPSPIRISYCDLDHRESVGSGDGPTLLYLPGAGERRYYCMLWADALARKHKIRFLHPDRFGIGGSGDVPLEWRIDSFVDLVEALLARLGIERVALVSHSAGAFYTFNLILRLRHILLPENPYVCFMAPWVLSQHSKAALMRITSHLPDFLIYHGHCFDLGLSTRARHVFGNARCLLSQMLCNLSPHARRHKNEISNGQHHGESIATSHRNNLDESSLRNAASNRTSRREQADADTLSEQNSAVDRESQAPASDNESENSYVHYCDGDCIDDYLYLKCRLAEESSGIGDEFLLCLKRRGVTSWGLFSDYPEAIRLLQKQELPIMARRRKMGQPRVKLKIRVVYAEKDNMIGDRGAAWFDRLWYEQGEWADFLSMICPDSDHDSVPSGHTGPMDTVFRDVAECWEPPDAEPEEGSKPKWSKGW